MQGLTLFRRTNSPGFYNIASYHSPHSLTWSWILSFDLPKAGNGRWLHFSKWQSNVGTQWVFQFAKCAVRWQRQRPMWFRDLWQRARDENDELKHLTRTAMPRPPLRSPFKPTVIDGGNSVH